MSLTKHQARLLREIRRQLDVNDPGFSASEPIRAAFMPGIPDHTVTPGTFARSLEELKKTELYMSCGLYIHSWILPLIDELLEGEKS